MYWTYTKGRDLTDGAGKHTGVGANNCKAETESLDCRHADYNRGDRLTLADRCRSPLLAALAHERWSRRCRL